MGRLNTAELLESCSQAAGHRFAGGGEGAGGVAGGSAGAALGYGGAAASGGGLRGRGGGRRRAGRHRWWAVMPPGPLASGRRGPGLIIHSVPQVTGLEHAARTAPWAFSLFFFLLSGGSWEREPGLGRRPPAGSGSGQLSPAVSLSQPDIRVARLGVRPGVGRRLGSGST